MATLVTFTVPPGIFPTSEILDEVPNPIPQVDSDIERTPSDGKVVILRTFFGSVKEQAPPPA